MKYFKTYEGYKLGVNGVGSLRNSLTALKRQNINGRYVDPEILAKAIRNEYEAITGEKYEDEVQMSMDNTIADIIGHYKLDGPDFMAAWDKVVKESVNEAKKYSVHYSDGMRAGKEFKSEREAMQYAQDLIKNKKGLQFVSVHKPGMSQTAHKEDLLGWWGDGSYWGNVSKKDKDVAKMKIGESTLNEGMMSELDLMAKEAKSFSEFLKDVFSIPEYIKHKGKRDVEKFLKDFYFSANESVTEGKLNEFTDLEILGFLTKSKENAMKNKLPKLVKNLQKHIKNLEKKIKLSKTIPVLEAEDPMSSLLQSFEKAMTDKKAYAAIVAELEGAPDDVKPKIMQMADEFIPAKTDGILELIDELESGEIDPEDIGAQETKEVLIQQFKQFIKVTEFAIKTIKKHVNESVTEGKSYQEKFKEESDYYQEMINDPKKRVYDIVDFAQFTTGGMTQKQWEMFMYGRYKKNLQSKDSKIKEKMYKVLTKWLGESVNEASRLSFRDAGITDLVDLEKAIESFKTKDISWNQKGQAFMFSTTQDLKKAKEVLDINENELNEKKVPVNRETIELHINSYRVDDDPYYVAIEIGNHYKWTQKEIEKAEKLIRKYYLR